MNKIRVSKTVVACWIVLALCAIFFFKTSADAHSAPKLQAPPMSVENANGSANFVFYFGHNGLYTSIKQETGIFYYDWNERDYEKAYRKACVNRDKYDLDTIEFYNASVEVFRVLASWNYYLWNLEGCGINSDASELIDYTSEDGTELQLLYDPKVDDDYYKYRYRYYKAYAESEDKIYDYYISQYGSAVEVAQDQIAEKNNEEMEKLDYLWAYDLRYRASH